MKVSRGGGVEPSREEKKGGVKGGMSALVDLVQKGRGIVEKEGRRGGRNTRFLALCVCSHVNT